MARAKKVHFEAFKRYGIWQINHGRSDFGRSGQTMPIAPKGKCQNIQENLIFEYAGKFEQI